MQKIIPVENINYPSYQKREEVKSQFSDEYSKADSVSKKVWLLLFKLIWAHYWRARIGIENQKNTATLLRKVMGKRYSTGYVLDIDDYTRHWLASNGDRYEKEVIKAIKETWYEAEPSKYLPKGASSYIFHRGTA
jgi:hypothetical protein